MSHPPTKITGPVHLKLTLLGDGRVGKTSLRRQYLGQGFPREYLETLGADFAIKTTKFKKLDFRYQIWDIAGQPRFNQIRKSFYVGAQAALVLYDITNLESYNNMQNWFDELWKSNGKGKEIPVVIIGNKIDLRHTFDNPLNSGDGSNLANEISEKEGLDFTIPFLETSAKTGENVEEAFNLITEMFLKIHNLVPED